MIFVTSLAMLGVKVICGPILSDTRGIMRHRVELWEVEMTLVCGLVNRAELLEYSFRLVNPV